MIRIGVCRQDGGMEISAVGHAGYAERGQDIVCAGVSALLFGLADYLEHRVPTAAATGQTGAVLPSVSTEAREGELWVRTRGMDGIDEAAWAVTRAGLMLIARTYPDCVSLSDEP